MYRHLCLQPSADRTETHPLPPTSHSARSAWLVRLQALLEAVPASADTFIIDTVNLHNDSFSGAASRTWALPSLNCLLLCI